MYEATWGDVAVRVARGSTSGWSRANLTDNRAFGAVFGQEQADAMAEQTGTATTKRMENKRQQRKQHNDKASPDQRRRSTKDTLTQM